MADRTNTPVAREAETDAQPSEAADGAAPKAAASGGFKAWIPLLATVVAMPVLAFTTTQFILLPKIKQAMGVTGGASADAAAASSKEGEATTVTVAGKEKYPVKLPKILVNVAGSMMTRYLTMSVTLVGSSPDFKDKIVKNMDQLMDLANSALMTKTIQDLEKPGSRNQIRSELMTVFNNALGGPVVQDIYITEQAIQ
jgi:flagellar basal body-associated protein FliL